MMKILVLGHKGMLGSDLVSILSVSHDVTGKDIEDFDISSARDCRDIILESGPDVVVNAAAYTDVDGCESNREECFSVNAEGVKNVALICKERGIKIVHFSTDYVFDGTKGSPYLEDDVCNPINVYGESKLEGELYLRDISDNYILLRTAWLYGKNGKNFVRTIIEKAKNTKNLEVVDDQIGSPTCTIDLASAVKALIEGDHTGVFHVTNGGEGSWYEFALKALEYAGITDVEVEPVKSDRFVRKALRPRYSVLNCKKFIDETKMSLRSWQTALKDYVSTME
ncbi:MAG: dTDP-4-dehydrorhamnose reductase [Thermodesulfobacteriota bacterium]|nr:dTDP-4-dehydrorhamnose reductase [Thermodesulfobacteriota bacterium]